MKKGDYLAAKEESRRPTKEAIIILLVFIVVFIAVIFRFAVRSGTNEGFFSVIPTKKQAYQASRDLIRSKITAAGDVIFPDNDFQCSKNSDSIYVIKAFYTVQDSYGHEAQTNFTATLRYNGGSSSNSRNWKMITFQQEQQKSGTN